MLLHLIVHTDRGSQYVSKDFRDLLKQCGLRQSMSGKGNCYRNAQAESFFSRFKTELIEGGIFASLDEARSEIFHLHRGGGGEDDVYLVADFTFEVISLKAEV